TLSSAAIIRFMTLNPARIIPLGPELLRSRPAAGRRDFCNLEPPGNEQFVRLRAAEGLDLGQAERRPVRQHQPSDRRPDPRQGAAGRPSPPPALFAGD